MKNAHSFHLPVMGVGFTIDTPLKVAQYGIDSVIFIGDDMLLEKMRKKYCEKFNLAYDEISEKMEDYRAERITSYLNLIKKQVEVKFEELKNSSYEKGQELKKYFDMLPSASQLKDDFLQMKERIPDVSEMKNWLEEHLPMGSINVNIMTKLDKDNYKDKEQLPVEFNDAHAALRGFAKSDLESSIIFSAGMNPRLYGYIAKFNDFFPTKEGYIKKKVVLKVSDFRSALIQGVFLAKRGIWVSEYRIESGLNCGGHAFATEGYLMGPILQEFKEKKSELITDVFNALSPALEGLDKIVPTNVLDIKVTAQGGIGTGEEHKFMHDYYEIDSTGWGTPFLLVPEVTNVDQDTLQQLLVAKENDLYLSDVSPLGVPFNNLKGTSKDIERVQFIEKGRPGSSCPKKHLSFNKEFTEQSICTASRQFQHLKLKELDEKKDILSAKDFSNEFKKITDKSCLCVGLGNTALMVNDVEHKKEGNGVHICPGPNMAYYDKVSTLADMSEHIYNRESVISRNDRPNIFVKEMGLYMSYLQKELDNVVLPLNRKQVKYFNNFVKNMENGILYYQELFSSMTHFFQKEKNSILIEMSKSNEKLLKLKKEIESILPVKKVTVSV